MDNLKERILAIKKFTNDRDWMQFHNPKNLAISISLEANELLEHFQFLSMEQSERYVKDPKRKEEIADEMADIFHYLLELAHNLDIDLIEASKSKMKKVEAKYPIEKAKGRAEKYNKL